MDKEKIYTSEGYKSDDRIASKPELCSDSNLGQNRGHAQIAEEIIAYCKQYANYSLRVIAVYCPDMDNMKE